MRRTSVYLTGLAADTAIRSLVLCSLVAPAAVAVAAPAAAAAAITTTITNALSCMFANRLRTLMLVQVGPRTKHFALNIQAPFRFSQAEAFGQMRPARTHSSSSPSSSTAPPANRIAMGYGPKYDLDKRSQELLAIPELAQSEHAASMSPCWEAMDASTPIHDNDTKPNKPASAFKTTCQPPKTSLLESVIACESPVNELHFRSLVPVQQPNPSPTSRGDSEEARRSLPATFPGHSAQLGQPHTSRCRARRPRLQGPAVHGDKCTGGIDNACQALVAEPSSEQCAAVAVAPPHDVDNERQATLAEATSEQRTATAAQKPTPTAGTVRGLPRVNANAWLRTEFEFGSELQELNFYQHRFGSLHRIRRKKSARVLLDKHRQHLKSSHDAKSRSCWHVWLENSGRKLAQYHCKFAAFSVGAKFGRGWQAKTPATELADEDAWHHQVSVAFEDYMDKAVQDKQHARQAEFDKPEKRKKAASRDTRSQSSTKPPAKKRLAKPSHKRKCSGSSSSTSGR